MDTTTTSAAVGPSPVLLILPLLVFLALNYATSLISLPKAIPWVGKSDKLLAESRASWACFKNAQAWLAEGYHKVTRFHIECQVLANPLLQYSKRGKSYIFPDFTGRPTIMVYVFIVSCAILV